MLIELGLLGLTGFCLGEIIDIKQLIGYGIDEIEFKKKCDNKIDAKRQDYILTLGQDENGNDINVDMLVDSHMLISGISNCGKSKLAEDALQGKEVTILNAFEDDFKSLGNDRINGNENILNYLKTCEEGRTKDSKPHYVLIDEMLVLLNDNKNGIGKAIFELLADCRHYRLYVIGITQEATKETVKAKNLFNVRVAMKQLEDSAYKTILGCTVKDNFIKQREFYVVDNNGLRRGHTKFNERYIDNFNNTEEDNTEVIEEHDSDITEEVINEISNVIIQEPTNTTIQALVKEEIKNKSLAELVNEVDNLKAIKEKVKKK